METKVGIAYLNGEFLPADKAAISPLDRGVVFGDGIYEVLPVIQNKLIHLSEHINRLNQSLNEIRMQPPYELSEWEKILDTLVQKNGGGNQWIYLQITRGTELIRNQEIPKNIRPNIFAISYPKILVRKEDISRGFKVTLLPDIRWKYCHIKTTARLANILLYQEARDAGFDEAIIMNGGFALEGTSSNLFIARHGVLITPPKSPAILAGITRDRILALADSHKIPYRENKITERDLHKADEIWLTSSVRGIHPVVDLDGNKIGNGESGPVWSRIWDIYTDSLKA